MCPSAAHQDVKKGTLVIVAVGGSGRRRCQELGGGPRAKRRPGNFRARVSGFCAVVRIPISEGEGFAESGSATDTKGAFKIKTGKRLYRDSEEQVVGGVAAGLTAYFGIADPIWIRLFFVLVVLVLLVFVLHLLFLLFLTSVFYTIELSLSNFF